MISAKEKLRRLIANQQPKNKWLKVIYELIMNIDRYIKNHEKTK